MKIVRVYLLINIICDDDSNDDMMIGLALKEHEMWKNHEWNSCMLSDIDNQSSHTVQLTISPFWSSNHMIFHSSFYSFNYLCLKIVWCNWDWICIWLIWILKNLIWMNWNTFFSSVSIVFTLIIVSIHNN